MAPCHEAAAAKVNLTLRVLGRRPDGYHELASLVAFARVADMLELTPGEPLSLSVRGPFASALGAENLVLDAARSIQRQWPDSVSGAFRLDKRVPVAAGLGGGSADAAAALRLALRVNPGLAEHEVAALCADLGADVPVCFRSLASFMTGIGENVRLLPGFPEFPAVLVNPGAQLSTADVFEERAASAASPAVAPPMPGSFDRPADVVAYVQEQANDLEAPASRLLPEIADVLTVLRAAPGCLVARLSGSGPTCFGLFESDEQASAAERVIAAAHPRWWVTATVLG